MYHDYSAEECRDITMIDKNFPPETAAVVHRYCAACACELPNAKLSMFYVFESLHSRAGLIQEMYKSMSKARKITLGVTAERSLAMLMLSEIIVRGRKFSDLLLGLLSVSEASIIFDSEPKAAVFERLTHSLCYAAVMIAALAFDGLLRKYGTDAENMDVDKLKTALREEIDLKNVDTYMQIYSSIYNICRKQGFYTGTEHMPVI